MTRKVVGSVDIPQAVPALKVVLDFSGLKSFEGFPIQADFAWVGLFIAVADI